MTVIVNNSKIRIFSGAQAGDVLLRYLARKKLDNNDYSQYVIRDNWGHILDKTSPIKDGQVIKINKL